MINKDKRNVLMSTSSQSRRSTTEWMKLCNSIENINTPELSRKDYMIDSREYCFTRDDFIGMGIKNIADLNRYKHPYTNVKFSDDCAFNEDDKRRMMKLFTLHYIPNQLKMKLVFNQIDRNKIYYEWHRKHMDY